MPRIRPTLPAALTLATLQTGCAVFSPLPLWEVAKATGLAASTHLAGAEASQTIYQPHAPVEELCIEFNRDCPVADLIPALQGELRSRQVRSRVFDAGTPPTICTVWLRYRAALQWDVAPLSSEYRPYMTAATLTLHTGEGRVLASSRYEWNSAYTLGKWAQTRTKLAPAVGALLTEFEN